MKKSLAIPYRTPPRTGTPRWRTRGAVVALGIGLWLAIVVAYAWPNWAMVAYRLIYDGGVLICWLAAALGIGAALLPAFLPDRPSSGSVLFRGVTAAALGLGVLSLLTLELGLAGALNSPSAIVLLVAGIAAGSVRLVRGWNGENTARDRLAAPAAAIAGGPSPSPGTPGEGRGEGLHAVAAKAEIRPHPNPLPAYRERGPENSTHHL